MTNEDAFGDAAERADELAADGQTEQAIEVLTLVLEQHGDHGGVWNNLGALRVANGELQLAVDAYSQAIALRYPSQVGRGLAYELLKDQRAAATDYLEALRAEPDDIPALVNLGTLLVQLGESQQALTFLTRAAALDPTAHWQLADAYIALERGVDAIASAETAIAAGEHRAHLTAAETLAAQGEWERAETHFRAAVERDALDAHRSFAAHLDVAGRDDEALQVALTGLERGDSFCLSTIAIILEGMGRHDEAIEYYERAVANGEREYADDLEALKSARARDSSSIRP